MKPETGILLSLLSAVTLVAGPSAPLDVNAMIRDAVKAGRQTVTLPPGRHLVNDTVQLDRCRDFTLNGNGATLVFRGNTKAVAVRNSRNITLKNFTIDYDPLPYTQGQVLKVDAARNEVTVRLHDGYPDLFRRRRLNLQVYDPHTRQLKRDGGDLFNGNVTAQPKPRTYTLKFGRRPADILSSGDLVAIDWRQSNGIELYGVNGARLENLTLLASPNAGIMGRYISGTHLLRRIVIRRGEHPPAGATEPRLLSTAADAINYAVCERGPTVEECDISFQGDDSINFHGPSLAILRQEAPDTLIAYCYHDHRLLTEIARPGMAVRVMREPEYRTYAVGELRSLTWLKDEKIDLKQLRQRFPRSAAVPEPPQSVFRLKLAAPLALQPGDNSIDLPAVNGGGFVIRNNYFHDHRAMAIRMMAGDGIIENNRFERIMKAAISIGPEYQPWREAGWVENLIIRGNRFRDICTEPRNARPDSGSVGAIFVRAGIGAPAGRGYPGNRNLTIADNRIDGCRVAGIYIANADGVILRRNFIQNVLTDPRHPAAGADSGWQIKGPITISPECRNVANQP